MLGLLKVRVREEKEHLTELQEKNYRTVNPEIKKTKLKSLLSVIHTHKIKTNLCIFIYFDTKMYECHHLNVAPMIFCGWLLSIMDCKSGIPLLFFHKVLHVSVFDKCTSAGSIDISLADTLKPIPVTFY